MPDRAKLNQLVQRFHEQMRETAVRLINKELRSDHTLQVTALVNEAYVKLAGSFDSHTDHPGEFLAACCKAMKEVLVDHARKRGRKKRGGNVPRLDLNSRLADQRVSATELVELDDLLTKFAKARPRHGQCVYLYFFGGLSLVEIGDLADAFRDRAADQVFHIACHGDAP